MIPKIIHLCWFGGGEYPQLINMCILSWKKLLPDYKIMIWNEDSFDISSTIWTKEAYQKKKWAFVSDYVRLFALYHFGGVYLDTDVEVLKDFSELLENKRYVSSFVEGYLPSTSFIACESKYGFIKELMNYYENRSFLKNDGTIDMTMNPLIFAKTASSYFGFSIGTKEFYNKEASLFPYYYFMPYKKNIFLKRHDHKSYILKKETYVIHHDMGSWNKRRFFPMLVAGLARLIVPSSLYLKWKLKKFLKEIKNV